MTIRSFFRQVKHVVKWLPVIWKDRDWDYSPFMTMLEFKLRNMFQFYTSGEAYSAEANDVAFQIDTVLFYIERIKKDKYDEEACKELGIDPALLYDFETVFIPSLDGETSHMVTINDKISKADRSAIYKREEELRQHDYDMVFDLIKRDIRKWWD